MRRKTVLTGILTGLIAFAVFAQDLSLTLDEVIQRGLEQNLSIRIAELNVQNKRTALDSAFNVFYPDLRLDTTLLRSNRAEEGTLLIPDPTSEFPVPGTGVYDRVITQSYSVNSNVLNLSLSGSLAISLAIFDGIDALKADYAASLISYEEAAKRLERDLKKNFYALILQKEQIEILSESRDTMEARYRQTLTDFQNGFVPEIAVLNAQVAYENMGPIISEAQRNYDYAMSLFKQSPGIDQDLEIELVGEINVSEVAVSDDMLSVDQRFDVRSQQGLIELAEIQKAADFHANFLPSLVLAGSFSPSLVDPYNGEQWSDLFSQEWSDRWVDGGSLSLTVSVPLASYLPRSAARVNQEALENSIRSLQLQEQAIRDLGEVEIANTLESLSSSLRSITTLELTLRTNERNTALVGEAYNAGSRSQLDVDVAEDELRQAQLNLLNEQYRYLSYVFDLEYLLNRDFDVAQ
jgi:outer membrane protein TolC